MFKHTLALNPTEHANLHLSQTTDWRFAAKEILVPIVISEVADAAREYPLIFLQGKNNLYALTGIEQGVNAYVDAQGHWLAHYIPAHLRNYPFALAAMPDKEAEFAVVFDSQAHPLQQPNGQPLFVNGQPSPMLAQRMQQLKTLHQAQSLTEARVTAISQAGLLKAQNITVQQNGKTSTQIAGLQIIDENKLNTLSTEELARLHRSGALPLIYAHLISLANLRQSAIAGKYPQFMPTTVPATPLGAGYNRFGGDTLALN